MIKCDICGKEYIKNETDLSLFPESIRKHLEYKPDCNCLEKQEEKKRKKESAEFNKLIQKMQANEKINKYKRMSIADKKFNESTFEKADNSKVIQLCKKYAEALVEKEENFGLILYSGVGTGKTYASACIGNYLMSKYKTVLAISLSQYLSKIRQRWDEAENELLEAVRTCDLLIIDDFGLEKTSEWAEEKIFNLIDVRYRAEKSLVITTNLIFNKDSKKCEFVEKLDGKGRIRDRIIEMCFPYFVEGESKRKIKTGKQFMDFINKEDL